MTWNEPKLPNWVGHFLTTFCHPPRYPWPVDDADSLAFTKLMNEWIDNPVLVYDYAKGGDTTAGIKRQVEQSYLPHIGQKPSWAQWRAHESLFGKFNIWLL